MRKDLSEKCFWFVLAIRAWEIGVRYFIFWYFVTKFTLSPNGYTIDYVVVHWFDPNLKGSLNVSPAYSSPINQFCSLHNPSLHISKVYTICTHPKSAHLISYAEPAYCFGNPTALQQIAWMCVFLYLCVCVLLYLWFAVYISNPFLMLRHIVCSAYWIA